jgi:molybdate transport repressor ModE-like protein
MLKVEIRADWLLRQVDGSVTSLPQLLALLMAVRSSGSISKAAAECKLSYRHAWGMLQEFDSRYGVELVRKVRGQGSALSPLAEKLIWADMRIRARLAPLLDSLASELEQDMASVMPAPQQALRVTASHGFAIAALIEHLEARGTVVNLNYKGSTEAVASLAREECDLAGFHLPVGKFEKLAAVKYLPWLDTEKHTLIQLASRMQGIFVAKGNPRGITGLADLARPELRFVNRQQGSGTRVLLELLLADQGIASSSISGYESAEFTHAAVAAFVASGMADAAFGVETAARRFDLDFIPIMRERYFLACQQKALDTPLIQAALGVLSSSDYKAALAALPGYDNASSGEHVDMASIFG